MAVCYMPALSRCRGCGPQYKIFGYLHVGDNKRPEGGILSYVRQVISVVPRFRTQNADRSAGKSMSVKIQGLGFKGGDRFK